MDGPAPVSHNEIHQWSTLSGITPTPDEVEAIKLLDMELITAGRPTPPSTTSSPPDADKPTVRPRGRR